MSEPNAVHNVLVLGGTGFVGRAVCERLMEAMEQALRESGGGAMRITVPTRKRAHARAVQWLPAVEVIEADVHDDAALARLVRGRDAVVNLIAILHGDEAAFDRAHVQLPRRLAAACAAAGTRRIVHVSALGVDSGAPSRYLRSKATGEAVLRASGLDVTVLRPSIIFGSEDRFTNLFASLQAVLPVLPLAEAGARFQPVWVEDVARAIVACLYRPSTVGQVIECAGPDVMSFADVVKRCGIIAGRSATILPLPGPLARLQALLMELAPGEPLMSRDNLASLRVPNVATNELPGLTQLGIHAASLDVVGRTYLGHRGPRSHLDLLRRLARRG
jgi:uncharacterized protein YbjT (DUF2867 family)